LSRGALHARLEVEGEALLGERLVQQLGGLRIGGRDDARQCFDNRYLGAEALPDGAEFQADVATADDNQMGRHLVERQCLRRADDAAAVKGQGGEPNGLAAGGEDDVFRTQAGRRFLAALTALDRYLVSLVSFASEAGCPLNEGYLVLAEQTRNAGREPLDDVVLARHQGRQVKLNVADLDAVLTKVRPRLNEQFAAIEQGLAGD